MAVAYQQQPGAGVTRRPDGSVRPPLSVLPGGGPETGPDAEAFAVAEPHPAAGSRRASRARRWIEIAAAVVLVAATVEELSHVRYRMRRAATGWWEDFDHHERLRLELAALDSLARRLTR